MKYLIFTLMFLSLDSALSSDDECIIEPHLMTVDAWAQPYFLSPEEANRQLASNQVAEDASEHQPWQFLDVQSDLPATKATPRYVYDNKVLREMEKEEQDPVD